MSSLDSFPLLDISLSRAGIIILVLSLEKAVLMMTEDYKVWQRIVFPLRISLLLTFFLLKLVSEDFSLLVRLIIAVYPEKSSGA